MNIRKTSEKQKVIHRSKRTRVMFLMDSRKKSVLKNGEVRGIQCSKRVKENKDRD